MLSPDQDGEVIVTVHAIIRLLLSGVLKAPRSERSLTGDCIDQCCREAARVLAQGATVLDLIARQP